MLSLVAALALAAAPTTVQLDLQRFLGTWYELARFDVFYERGCVGVTATYSLKEDGELDVLNRCLKDSLDGEEKLITGKAWVPDPKAPGKLKVQFFWPFSGDYWVLAVAPDYSWAVVGNKKRTAAWLFSRTPKVDDGLYASLVAKLTEQGYDPAKLQRTPQR